MESITKTLLETLEEANVLANLGYNLQPLLVISPGPLNLE